MSCVKTEANKERDDCIENNNEKMWHALQLRNKKSSKKD